MYTWFILASRPDFKNGGRENICAGMLFFGITILMIEFAWTSRKRTNSKVTSGLCYCFSVKMCVIDCR